MLDSSNGGSNGSHEGIAPLDNQAPLFASTGAIIFPYPVSDFWTEKVLLGRATMYFLTLD